MPVNVIAVQRSTPVCCQVLNPHNVTYIKSTRKFLFRSLLAATLMSAFGAYAGDSAPLAPQAQLIGRFADGVSAGSSEIVAFPVVPSPGGQPCQRRWLHCRGRAMIGHRW